MGATNVTRQAELEQFYAYALPGFLDYLARHSAQMSDMEVVSSLDGITSMPAYQRLEGVEKTVLAPLDLLTKDVDEQVSAAMEATRNAQQATAAALGVVEESKTATEECKAATQAAIAATTDAQEATGLATEAANNADTARVRIENIEAEANSLIGQQQSALTETQAATAAAKTATTEAQTATANAKTATTNANAATEAANVATQAATEAKTACETATANAQAATAEALEAIANESARMEAETAREQAEAARAQAESERAAQWATWFEDESEGVKTLYNTWFNSTSAAWENFNSTASAQETARQSAEEGRQSAEADRVAAELERAAAENLRKTAETDRQNAEADRVEEFESMMADCDDATKLATAAAALAVSEAKKATDAAADASTATAAAQEATSKANTATSDANTATSNANMATSNANKAASRVDDAITSAEQATLAAISATEAANAAADSVATAKMEAQTAANNATTAAASATAAADSANSAAAAAIEAAERANAAASAKQIDWTNVINKPTTLSGYGITDASIEGGTINIGGQSITPLTEHQSLDNYPTKAEVDAELTLKAAKTEVDAALELKADKTEVVSALAQKADTTTIEEALAQKADKTTVDSELEQKAAKSHSHTKSEIIDLDLPTDETLTLTVTSEDGTSVEGQKVTINGFVYPLDSTGVVIAKIPFGVEYKIVFDKKQNYLRPKTKTFISSQISRDVACVYEMFKVGIFIQDKDGFLWTVDDWSVDNNSKANAIALITNNVRVLVALTEGGKKIMHETYTSPLEDYITAIPNLTEAKLDYKGAENTKNILKLSSSADFAAGWCDSFIFPDGKSMGHLPSLGELWEVYLNKTAVDAALSKCGGIELNTSVKHWSSTFYGLYNDTGRANWALSFNDGGISYYNLAYTNATVRAFANLE